MKKILTVIVTIIICVGIPLSQATVVKQSRFDHYFGLSSDTKPTLTGRDVGVTFYEADTRIRYTWCSNSNWIAEVPFAITATAAMTAPGNTAAVSARGYNTATWYFRITNINTSVTMILQGKVIGGKWGAIGADSTIYATNSNGMDGLTTHNIATLDSIRGRFDSEAGGTDAGIEHQLVRGRY